MGVHGEKISLTRIFIILFYVLSSAIVLISQCSVLFCSGRSPILWCHKIRTEQTTTASNYHGRSSTNRHNSQQLHSRPNLSTRQRRLPPNPQSVHLSPNRSSRPLLPPRRRYSRLRRSICLSVMELSNRQGTCRLHAQISCIGSRKCTRTSTVDCARKW